MDDAELLDIAVTMVSDLRMEVSQSREVAKREVVDSRGAFKSQAQGRIQALNPVYDKLDEILKTIKELGMKTTGIRVPDGSKQWNIMRISDEVWVSGFYSDQKAADAECRRMNAMAGATLYVVAEQ